MASKHIRLTSNELAALPQYDFTLPTLDGHPTRGVIGTKRWKRNTRWRTPKAQPHWLIGERADEPDGDGMILITWRELDLWDRATTSAPSQARQGDARV